MQYQNREHAGRYLARSLGEYAERADTIVLALPRGGVPVAYEIAKALRLPLDILVVRKLGVPGQEEAAFGAIATGGVRVLSNEVLRMLDLHPQEIEAIVAREERELKRRETEYRGDRHPISVTGATVILVDDGLATGSSMRAAVQAARQLGAAHIVVAVPVGSPDACRDLARVADQVVCPLQPAHLMAISLWYEDFAQTSDDEVRRILAEHDVGKHTAEA